MLLIRKPIITLLGYSVISALFLVAFSMPVSALDKEEVYQVQQQDTTPFRNTLPYPLNDRRGDYLSNRSSVYDFQNPSNLRDSVVYDPVTRRYTVYEKIGNKYYRVPMSYSFEEFWEMRNSQAERDYFQQRANTTNLLNRGKLLKPKLSLTDNLFNRLFGNGEIVIQPQGNVDITAGYQGQKIDNPTLPERARKNGGLDFNMDAQLNVNASIGDKLKFPINYNTLANFDMENQLKLDYTGKDDEILKRFEAGNVSFPSRGSLIPGAQQLFGLKTQLQFGKLYITSVLANQKSQRQGVSLEGGSASQPFEVKADEYEENRHFLLGQYFRKNYNKVMEKLPAINSQVQILRLEVWVTNKTGITTDTRDIVGLMDLGESDPFRDPPVITPLTTSEFPANASNDLYSKLLNLSDGRNPATIYSKLTGILQLNPVQDFEKTYARKLDSTQYMFNKQVGMLTLSQPLQTDEVLAVAFQYSYNGKIFQVGEFSQDVPPDTTSGGVQKILFLKLLKATSQRTNLPIWDLMMKNVYSVGFGVLQQADFKLDVLYQEPGLGDKRYVPFGDLNQGTPIISLVNLDRLNSQLDPQPDGVFDFVEGFTVLSQYSRVMFPVLEPFGSDLAPKVYTNPADPSIRDTLFFALYDSIKAVAQQFPNLNRFVLKGTAKTSGSADISIGYNIPKGSVSVTAGGRLLQEGVDYDINYDLGTIRITNQAILNAALPVQVNFENNASFGLQQRSYMGFRLDYLAKNTATTQLSFGATMVRLSERPFFTKVNLNEDPIRNTMYGLDVNYRKDVPRLTRILDKLPFYTTTAPSSINVYAEGAYFKPGHAPQIGRGSGGVIYIDDFEGSKSGIDLRFPPISWILSSVPQGATEQNSNNLLFPEASLNNDLNYGKNRAKIAWYQIEQTLQQFGGTNNPIGGADLLSDPRVRQIYQKEIFPQRTTGFGESQLVTFDLAYYPEEKGPYNYRTDSIDANGRLTHPKKQFGGLMRSLDQTDFETSNIEFIEFWLQDPYINADANPNPEGGLLYFNLGNVSEDVLKDGRRFYENGLKTPSAPAQEVETIWGRVPANSQQLTNAFSNNTEDRPYQDIGFDGLSDTAERNKRSAYLGTLQANFGIGSKIYQDALNDPSSDDYRHYRDGIFSSNDGILARYKNYNNAEGNSPISDGSQFSSAATLYPDAEELNRDNTMNETEEYFQYIVEIRQKDQPIMQKGSKYVVDRKDVIANLANGQTRAETWYQFRIPIGNYDKKIGNIPDFKSIRFIRMFMTDFKDSTVLRFAELQLARNVWRKFPYKVDATGLYSPQSPAPLNVGAVNIEENDKRVPLPYRTPREIERVQTLSNNGVNLLQNEQSMTLQFCDLSQNDAKAVTQTFANRDLRQFGKLSMYIHAEEATKNPIGQLKDDMLTAVVRLGTDFVSNYYEIRIPLRMTSLLAGGAPDTDEYNDTLWNPHNSLEVDLNLLTRIKQSRNLSSADIRTIFRQAQSNGHIYSVMGNPNLGEVRGILIGVENTASTIPACGEVWVNELRLSSINEKGGWAALGRIDVNLADLGTLSVSANTHSSGFGTLEQKINERYRDDFLQYDVAATLELGKLLPKKTGMSIPVYASYSQTVSTPEYDPYDMDIKLKDKLSSAPSKQHRDSIKNTAVDFTSVKTLNFTNVRKNKTNGKKPKIYDIENVDVSYSYIKTENHTPLIESNVITRNRGAIGYNFAPQPKYIEPFKGAFKKTKTKWFDLVKDFNVNFIPSQLTFRADLLRQFGAIRPRSIGTSKYKIPETYDKRFTFQRDYILRWNFTRSISFDYTATNNSVIDEPYGRLDTKEKKDTVKRNLLKGGRNVLFNQVANFAYTVPTSKLPLLDWTTVNLKYQATYNWIGASRLAVELGNVLENGQQKEGTVQFDFTRLYQKSKWLRQLDQPSNKEDKIKWKNRITKVKDSVTTKSGKRILQTRRIVDKTAMPYVSTPVKIFGKILTSVKQVNLSVAEVANTRLPGYMDSTQHVGQNFKSMQPGLGFILGQQPDTNWLNQKAREGVITRDTNFNTLFQQTYDQRITLSAQLEPVRDLSITVNLSKTFTKSYTETFRYIDTSGQGNRQFMHLNPYAGGGFDVSYIAFKTLFQKFDPNRVSETFKKFEANRVILSERVGKLHPNSFPVPGSGGYYYGYGKYAVDVLIPSFIAAYTGQDPYQVALIKQSNPRTKSNPFKAILPKPNWKIDYSGLTRIKGLEKIFTSFNISHGYTGNLSMNGFTSALFYQDTLGSPKFYDTVSNNYIPYFLVPNVTIQESFSPLIGFDVMFTNQFQAKFEYSKSRTLSLSLNDYQLSEVRSTEFVIGAGYRKRGLNIFNITLPKWLSKDKSSKLDNEINFRVDFRIRDNVNANSRLDQDQNFATGGSKETTISPTIDYFLNNRINIKLFYDRRRMKPYISSSAPTTNTRAGIQVRISLAQ